MPIGSSANGPVKSISPHKVQFLFYTFHISELFSSNSNKTRESHFSRTKLFNSFFFKGPKEITCRHFWQMILEHNIGVIVMLCRLREMRNGREKEKCHKYWPDDTNNYKKICKSFFFVIAEILVIFKKKKRLNLFLWEVYQ